MVLGPARRFQPGRRADASVPAGDQLGVAAAANAGIITPAASESPSTWIPSIRRWARRRPFRARPPVPAPAASADGYATPKPRGGSSSGSGPGRRIEGVVRYTGHVTNTAASAINVDMANPVTPIFPPKPTVGQSPSPPSSATRTAGRRPASATLAVSGPAGLCAPVGTEIWPSTIPDGADVLRQRRELHLAPGLPGLRLRRGLRASTVGDRPTLKLKVSGATPGESCTGANLRRATARSGPAATSSTSIFDWKHLKVACQEAARARPSAAAS